MSYWDHPLSSKENRKIIMSKNNQSSNNLSSSDQNENTDSIMFSPSTQQDKQKELSFDINNKSTNLSSNRQPTVPVKRQHQQNKQNKNIIDSHESIPPSSASLRPHSSPIPSSFLSTDVKNNTITNNTLLPPSPIPSNIKSESNIKIEESNIKIESTPTSSPPTFTSIDIDAFNALMRSNHILTQSLNETNKNIKDYMNNTDQRLEKLEHNNSTIISSFKTYNKRLDSINDSLENYATTTALSTLETEFNDRIDTIEHNLPDEFELKDEIKDEINDDIEEYVKDKKILDDIKSLKETNQLLQDQVKIILHSNNSPTSSSTFSTHSDDTLRLCPILKANKKEHHFSKFTDNLKNIKLQSDKLRHLELFWDSITTALSTTLGSAALLPLYQDLYKSHKTDLCQKNLLPPPEKSFYPEALSSYMIFARTLHIHLLQDDTFNKSLAPRAYNIFSVYKLQGGKDKDGFVLLTEIIYRVSPQLDGPIIDLSTMILSFTLTSGTTYLSFHQDALGKLYEISLHRDQTGAFMRFIERYVTLLRMITSLDVSMVPIQQKLRRHIRKNGYTKHPHDEEYIQKIYEELTDDSMCIPPVLEPDPTRIQNQEVVTTPSTIVAAITNNVHAARLTKSSVNTNEATRVTRHNSKQNRPYSPASTTKCLGCGMSNAEIHRALKHLHTGDPDTCPFRDPSFNNSKIMREYILQYNLKHGSKAKKSSNNVTFQKNLPSSPNLPTVNSTLTSILKDSSKDDDSTNDQTSTNDDEKSTTSEDVDDTNAEHAAHSSDPFDKAAIESDDNTEDIFSPIVGALSNQTSPSSDTNSFNQLSSFDGCDKIISSPDDLRALHL